MIKHSVHIQQVLSNQSIKSLFTHKNTKNWPVNLILPATEYQIRLIELPEVNDDDLLDAITLKANDFIDYPIEQAIVDFIDIPKQAFFGRRRMGYVVISSHQRMVHYLHHLQLSGLQLHCIDIEDMGLRNLALLNHKRSRCGLLAIAEQHTQINLCFDQQLVLTRKIDISLNSLIEQHQSNEIQKQALVLEIQRSFDYFQSQLGLGLVEQLNISIDNASNHAQSLELIIFLKKNINCHIELINLEPQVACKQQSDEQNYHPHLMAVAAGLRYVEQTQ